MQAFADLDTDQNGKLSAFELAQLLRKHGVDLSFEEIESILQRFDADRDGHLDAREFAHFLQSGAPAA